MTSHDTALEAARTAIRKAAFRDPMADISSLAEVVISAYLSTLSPVSADAVVEACAKVADAETGPLAIAIASTIRALKGTFPAVDGWQTMDSAPKDGSGILLAHAESVFDGYWWPDGRDTDSGEPGWVDGSTDSFDSLSTYHPTRWQPLPAAPSTQEADTRSALVDPEGGV